MAKVTETILLTLMPIICAAPLSSETASMARPVRVFLTNSVKPTIRIAPQTTVMILLQRTATDPIFTVPSRSRIEIDLCSAPQISCAIPCSR